MTLEQEAAKERGGFGVRPPGYGGRRPSSFEALLRGAAFLLLLAFLAGALLVLWTYFPVGFVIAGGASWMFLAFLASRSRELRLRIASLETEMETLKSANKGELPPPNGP